MNNNAGQMPIADTISVLHSEINEIKTQQTQNAASTNRLLLLVEKFINNCGSQELRINALEKKLKRKSILLGITTSATVLLTIAFVWTLLT